MRVICEHPDLAWFSNYTRRFRRRSFFPLAFLSRALELPVIGSAIPYDWNIRPKPRESNKLFRVMSGGTFSQPKPLDASGRQPVVLADIVWKTLMYCNEAELAHVEPRQKFEVNYTDFVSDPIGMMDRVRTYCELPKSAVFERRIKRIRIHNADDKWERDLSTEQKRILMKTIGAELEHFGFKVQGAKT